MEEMAASKSVLEVHYQDEVGIGLGPTLEFYTLVSRELQQADLHMWRGDPCPLPGMASQGEGGREGGKEGGREREREREREGGREKGREGEREREREGRREGGREGEREGGREGGPNNNILCDLFIRSIRDICGCGSICPQSSGPVPSSTGG